VALLHLFLILLALLRRHVAHSLFTSLHFLAKLLSLGRRHISPTLAQLPALLGRQTLEPLVPAPRPGTSSCQSPLALRARFIRVSGITVPRPIPSHRLASACQAERFASTSGQNG